MKKMAIVLATVSLSMEIFAQRIILPPPRLVIPRGPDQQMQLQEMDVAASVRGLYATVETTLTFFNPNKGSVLEGELIFPLPDKASVCGYSLDINGALVDGVVVPKEQARVAFETEARRGVDPGLVEAVKGNVYRTRIYPLPAAGSRKVRLAYTTPLAVAPNGDAALALPMPREKIGRRVLRIEVADIGKAVPQVGGLGDKRFAQAEGFWRVSSEEADITPGDDICVALPSLPSPLVSVETAEDGTHWFFASVLAPMPAAHAAVSYPTSLDILWDASGSRAGASLDAEFSLIESLPEQIKEFRLIVFRDTPEPPRSFPLKADLAAALKAVVYDGGTDFKALAKALPKDNASRLLFTDGLDTLSGDAFAFEGRPPTAIVSATVADREMLRQACGGALIDLATTTVKDALARIFAPPPRVTAVEGAGIAQVQGIGQSVSGRVSVLGRLTAEETSITINMGAAGSSASIRLRKADARKGSLLATAWAAARISQLAPRAEDFTDELLVLGRSYGVVSPVTSLLVLDTLDQWLRYKIEPPASQPALREQWLAEMKRRGTEADNAKTQHLAQLERNWKERVEWWKRDFEKDPIKVPPSPQRPGVLARALSAVTGNARSNGGALMSAPAVEAAEDRAAADGVMASAAAAPVAKRDRAGASATSAASIQIKAWSPDTPYLKALKGAAKPEETYGAYAAQRKEWAASPAFYLDCAGFFLERKDQKMGLRVLSNLAEMKIEDSALLRVFAWRLLQAGELDRAVALLRRILKLRGEEAQSYRDLALALAERGKLKRSKADLEEAMSLFLRVALTPWARHGDILPIFALEELNALVSWSDAQLWPKDGKPVVPEYDAKFKQMMDTDIRIVMSWDADATDIDLHVVEPSKEEAFYGHNRTAKGGYVSRDITDGYGPEEYMIHKAPHGKYAIRAKYYSSHQQTVVGPAVVTATVFTDWGRKEERKQRMSLRLEKVNEEVDIGSIQFGGAVSPDCADFSRLAAGMAQKDALHLLGEPNGKNGLEWTYLKGKRTIRLVFGEDGKLLRALELLPGGITNVLVQ